MDRRGLSGVVVSMILIGVALVVVAIGWFVINTILEEQGGEVLSASARVSQSCASAEYFKMGEEDICVGSISYMGGGKCCGGELISFSNDLVSWWKFEGNANDEVGGNDGVLYGDVEFIDDGERGMVASFDGSGDYISVPDSDDWFFGTSNFAIEVWVKALDWEGVTLQSILSQYLNGNNRWDFGFDSANKARFHQMNSAVEDIYLTNMPVWTDNTWHHLVIVREDGSFKIYGDSQELNNGVSNTYSPADSIPNITSSLLMGRLAGYSYYLKGSIDEVRIFNRALSEEEVGALYELG